MADPEYDLIGGAKNALECCVSVLNCDFGDMDPEAISDMASAARDLTEVMLLLKQDEARRKLSDAIGQAIEGAIVPVGVGGGVVS